MAKNNFSVFIFQPIHGQPPLFVADRSAVKSSRDLELVAEFVELAFPGQPLIWSDVHLFTNIEKIEKQKK